MREIKPALPPVSRRTFSPRLAATFLQCRVMLLLVLWSTAVESRPLSWSREKYTDQTAHRPLGDVTHSAGVQVGTDDRSGRAVKQDIVATWPRGIVPYRFDDSSGFETEREEGEYQDRVREAMDWWQNSTCVEFQLVTKETETGNAALIIRMRNETIKCTSFAGYAPPPVGHSQLRYPRLQLDMTCLATVGLIAHEIGHIIGLQHEHQRGDRDAYILVNHSNIWGNRLDAYDKVAPNYTYYSTPYDLGSIMHYPLKNGDAIEPNTSVMVLREGVSFPGTIGQRNCLSYYDIKAANLMYNCDRPYPEVTNCNFNKVKFSSGSGVSESGSGVSELGSFPGIRASESGSGVLELGLDSDALRSPEGQATLTANPVLVTVTTETSTPTLGPATSPTPSPAPSPVVTPSLNPRYIYPGDIVAFKGVPSQLNKWIGCNETTMCFAWGCPGLKFTQTHRQRCEAYKFTVQPVIPVASSERLRSGERVTLRRPHHSNNESYLFLDCPESGGQCTMSAGSECDCLNATTPHHCQCCRIFRLVARDRARGKHLRQRDEVMLVADTPNSDQLSLACNVTERRRRKRVCQLGTCIEPCVDTRHHFTLYKI